MAKAGRPLTLRPRKAWRRGLDTLKMKVVTTFYRRVIVLAFPLDAPFRSAAPPRLPVDLCILTEAELDAYLAFRPDQSRAHIRARLERGDRCFVCRHEGRIVDAGWAATGRVPVPYLHRDLVLPSGDVYVYDAHTLPECEGRGLYVARNAFCARHYQDLGFRRCLAVVAVENKVPLAVLRRNGARPVGGYTCLRCFGFSRVTGRAAEGSGPLPILCASGYPGRGAGAAAPSSLSAGGAPR